MSSEIDWKNTERAFGVLEFRQTKHGLFPYCFLQSAKGPGRVGGGSQPPPPGAAPGPVNVRSGLRRWAVWPHAGLSGDG